MLFTPSSPARALTTLVLALAVTLSGLFFAAPASAATYAGTATTPSNDGYWTVTSAGIVSGSGNAVYYGDLRRQTLNRPIVGISSTISGKGYWLVATDGGVFGFGDARFHGSTGAITLNKPIVGMAATPTNGGYWLVASDGGIFSFGDAKFFGSTGAIKLNQSIVAMAATPTSKGYWLVAADGGIFSFGDAAFFGSTGAITLNQPIVGMASTASGKGYWLVASDGGIFSFGDAPFRGAAVDGSAVFGMTPDGQGGYSILKADGRVVRLGGMPSSANTNPPVGFPTPTTTTTQAPVATTTTTTNVPVINVPVTVPATTTTTTTTAAPVTTTTTAVPVTTPPATVSSNPFSNKALWVDSWNPAKNQANAWRSSRPADAAYMDRMGSTSAAVWLGEWSGDVGQSARNVMSSAASSNSMPVFIAYNIPSRDCGLWSAGGASHAAAYQSWIRSLASGLGTGPAAVVLEPDALAGLDCLDAAGQQNRLALLADAVNVLSARPNTYVYLDAGHPGWHSANTMADRLRRAGVANARGFSLNVSNYDTTAQNMAYGDQIVSALGGKNYIIDTSRNGNGSNGEWCNPMGRALGQSPSTNTGNANADAFLWLKRPGESDGSCNGGPGAGQWWAEYALGLAKSAWG